MTIGAAKKSKRNDGPSESGASQEQEAFVKQRCYEITPLNQKLHYLWAYGSTITYKIIKGLESQHLKSSSGQVIDLPRR